MLNDPLVPIVPSQKGAWKTSLPYHPVLPRDELILSLAKGRSVLHLGATDSPLTQEKLKENRLLHLKLRQACQSVTGLDCDEEAADWIAQQTGVDDIVVADMTQLQTTMAPKLKQHFDLILCCDLIEHVYNAGLLLTQIKALCSSQTQLVITTPNALAFRAAFRTLFTAQEIVHPDHVAYYSLATLSTLLGHHGFTPIKYATYANPPRNPIANFCLQPLWKRFPHSADGLLVVATQTH